MSTNDKRIGVALGASAIIVGVSIAACGGGGHMASELPSSATAHAADTGPSRNYGPSEAQAAGQIDPVRLLVAAGYTPNGDATPVAYGGLSATGSRGPDGIDTAGCSSSPSESVNFDTEKSAENMLTAGVMLVKGDTWTCQIMYDEADLSSGGVASPNASHAMQARLSAAGYKGVIYVVTADGGLKKA